MILNHAIVLKEFGSEDVLSTEQLQLPRYGDDKILIKIGYAGLNPIDIKTRSGVGWAADKISSCSYKILGMEFSGRVQAVGANVVGFQVDDEVFGWSGFPDDLGAYQQYITVGPSSIVKRPDSIESFIASSIPVAGLTALQAVEKVRFGIGGLENRRVLVIGASGGCGHVALQILKSIGASVVGVCSSRRVAFLRSLGFDDIIEYDANNSGSRYKYDAVIDFVGIDRAGEYVSDLKENGYWLTIPTVSSLETIACIQERGAVGEGMLVELNKADILKLLELISSGDVKVIVDRIFQMTEVKQAHIHVGQNAGFGKAVLKMTPEKCDDC